MTWLAGVVPYVQATQLFERIGHVCMPTTSLWEQTQAASEVLRVQQQTQQRQVSVERVVLPPAGQDQPEPKGLSLDGGTLNLRGEGWKEFKVGTVYDLATETDPDLETGEEVEVACGVNIAYRAVLGSVADFAPTFWALAVEHAIPQAAEVAVTVDEPSGFGTWPTTTFPRACKLWNGCWLSARPSSPIISMPSGQWRLIDHQRRMHPSYTLALTNC